jgi:predicted metalloprotease with PDZ domain
MISKMNPAARLGLLLVATAAMALSQAPTSTMSFTVSMDRPSTHYYHVEFRCERLRGDTQDFKMPVWMPGYYSIQDYAKNVVNFKAADGAGQALPWSQTAKNTWRVKTGSAPAVVVSYDVYGFNRFVGSTYLDDQRGYFVAPSMYMYVAGMINHPVTVTIKPYTGWTTVANGLDPVPGKPYTFTAPDFDLLYDCPTMLGNHEQLQFEVNGVPHYVVAEDVPKSVNRQQMLTDLQKIVTTATGIIGDIPYKHYTFLLMGKGQGGVEHLTSAAMLFDGTSLTNPDGYRRWLSFASHEYFHTFNVKRIRPIALGPFDYDKENFTDMLWVSEGFTSYYQDIVVRRAGLENRDQYLATITGNIAAYENSPGHLFESAAQSSINVWHRGDDAANTTISYYNKGPAIAAMLDFKIRSQTKNQKSLDDVMRALYNEFYKDKKRGWTDEEFRAVCERIAGVSLEEIFDDYVYSTKEVNYTKYFALAGLKIDTELRGEPGAYLGAFTANPGGSGGGGGAGGRGAPPAAASHVISRVEYDSPAERGGLSAQDEIVAIDGIPLGVRSLDDVLKTMQPGDKIKILIARQDRLKELEVGLGSKMQRTFKIQPAENLTAEQSALLKNWINN